MQPNPYARPDPEVEPEPVCSAEAHKRMTGEWMLQLLLTPSLLKDEVRWVPNCLPGVCITFFALQHMRTSLCCSICVKDPPTGSSSHCHAVLHPPSSGVLLFLTFTSVMAARSVSASCSCSCCGVAPQLGCCSWTACSTMCGRLARTTFMPASRSHPLAHLISEHILCITMAMRPMATVQCKPALQCGRE